LPPGRTRAAGFTSRRSPRRATPIPSTITATPPRWADFADPLDAIGARFRQAAPRQRADGKPLSGENRRDLDALGLAADADRKALRQRYTELVHRYHPDRNGGDRSHEGRLQQVIDAYQRLRKAPAFA
jgi:DnaJ-domain-containing protein 1